MYRFFTPVITCLFLLCFQLASAQDGKIDSTFGTDGRILEPAANYNFYPRIITLSDQSILHLSFVSPALQIVKYTPNGAIDLSFGIKTYNLTGFPSNAWLLPSGKILIVGSGEGQAMVIQLNADGSYDNSFSGDGKVSVSIGTGTSSGVDLVVQPDGKIVIAAQASLNGDPVYGAARLLADGSMDVSFDGDGVAIVNINTGQGPQNVNSETVYTLAIQTDGKLILAGDITNYVFSGPHYVYTQDEAAIRLNTDGSRDLSFANNGLHTFRNYSTRDKIVDAQVQPDGKILLAIDSNRDFEYYYALIRRLDINGSQDMSTGSMVGGDNRGGVTDLAVQVDGKILISGWYDCYYCSDATGDNFYIKRYNADGSADNSFTNPLNGYGSNPASPSNGIPQTSEEGGTLASQGNKLLIGGFAIVNTYQPSIGMQSEERATIFRIHNSSPIIQEYTVTASSYVNIPAKIEAEAYTSYSGTQPEGTSDAGGGQNVGYIDNSDWMDYNIAVPAAGTYTVHLRVASAVDGGVVQFYNASGQMLASVNVPNTGGWQTWTTLTTTLNLAAGHQTLRVFAATGGWNLNWLEFPATTPPPPAGYVAIPAKIEAEAYTNMNGVQAEGTADAGGGENIGYIESGDWLDYNLSVPTTGSYTVHFRVASAIGGSFQVYSEGGQLLASLTVPNTGGWQAWTTVTTTLSLSAGNRTVRLQSSGGGWNINWMEFTQGTMPPPPPPSIYVTIPAKIEGEAFTAQSGTQTEGSSDAGGGLNVGFIDNGDWMEYKIHVPATGSYDLKIRTASAMDGGSFEVRTATGALVTTFSVPNTGGWQAWATQSKPVSLTAGDHTIRFTSTGANWNLNWLEFTQGNPPPPTGYVTIPTTIEAEAYTAQSGTQLEGTSDLGGGQNVGYIDQGDYLEYGIMNPVAGNYTVSFRVASQTGGGLFAVKREDGTTLELVMVPQTSGWQNWFTVKATINLPAGAQRLRLVSLNTAGWNINWISFAHTLNPEPLPGYVVIPAKVEAETAHTYNGISYEQTSDEGGGQNVGYIDQWDYLDLAITPQVGTSTYLATFRVASAMSGGTFEVHNEGGTVLATITVPNTGGWQNWVNVSAVINLQPFNQRLRLLSTGTANWNINWVDFALTPSASITGIQKAPLSQVVEKLQNGIALYPNPAPDQLNITLERQQEGRLLVEVISMNGTVQRSYNLDKMSGRLQNRVSLSGLQKGTYLVRFSMEGWTETRKIMKQ